MNSGPHLFIELRDNDVAGLQKAWRIDRLIADIGEGGAAEREIGYDDKGQLTHRWPGGESFAERGVLDLAVFDLPTTSDIGEAEFERLWNQAIDDEKFFAEFDPYGDRFGTVIPKWGCLLFLLVVAAGIYLIFRRG